MNQPSWPTNWPRPLRPPNEAARRNAKAALATLEQRRREREGVERFLAGVYTEEDLDQA